MTTHIQYPEEIRERECERLYNKISTTSNACASCSENITVVDIRTLWCQVATSACRLVINLFPNRGHLCDTGERRR